MVLAVMLTACGGGSDGGSTTSGVSVDSNSSTDVDTSAGIAKYVGQWRPKGVCVGPDIGRNSFTKDKYLTPITHITARQDGSLSYDSFELWFKNPACVGIGERDPNGGGTLGRSMCFKLIKTVTVDGKVFDQFGNCDALTATSLQRIVDSDLEIAENSGRVVSTYLRYQ